ncbi:MAG TPA: hypothetical protein VFU36_09090 [Jatrophihabitans sp.]|nr:hypothetical protein [Jatrophihabitans sp.]
MLAALLASLALLIRPAGGAGAATTLSDVSVSVRYGCGAGTQDNFVEVTLTPGAQVLDAANPQLVQVGLAVNPADDDLYPEGGPSLVSLQSGITVVRLAGPVTSHQHVFLRDYERTAHRNFDLPASCENIQPTWFGLADPDVYGNHQVTCSANSASMNLTLKNNNDTAVGYTVLLVRKDGQLSGVQNQGIAVVLAGQSKQSVTVTQPPTNATIYQYQVRVIAPDGQVTDVADVTMHCDSGQPGPHPSVTPTPVRPSHSPSNKPSSTPSSSHSPTSTPSHSRPRPSVTPSHSSAPSHTYPPSGGSGGPTGGSTGGAGGVPGPVSQTSASGPVLGDASSTSQPASAPQPLPTPSKKAIVEASRVSTVFVNPGFTGAAGLVLLCFAGAMAALLAANHASARRR